MSTPCLGFGIVGPGMIAGVIADALEKAETARLVAVSSRRLENARKFVGSRSGVAALEGMESLLAHSGVEAVYLATPTVAKEQLALAVIAAGKHVLVDKPFVNRASVVRITEAATARGVVFMDATHFVHHPRTEAIRAATAEKIGSPRSLQTTFYFPFSDRNNIRFDAAQEPMTALGDMAWYSMRAIIEYLRPAGEITKAVTAPERDPQTGAIVRASGLLAFASGEISTYEIGYTTGTAIMDLQLLGTSGVIGMDDFVLDWANSFAYQNPDLPAGYFHRTGLATRRDVAFIATLAQKPQEVAMLEHFAEMAVRPSDPRRHAFIEATLATQALLDAAFAGLL